MSGNLFAAAPAVIAELRRVILPDDGPPMDFDVAGEPIDPVKIIDSAAALAGQPNMLPFCPGLFVLQGGTDATSPGPNNPIVNDEQGLIVSVVVKHVPTRGGLSTESLAGAYGYAVVNALHGFVMPAGYNALQYQGALEPVYYKSGAAEFPLRFRATMILKTEARRGR